MVTRRRALVEGGKKWVNQRKVKSENMHVHGEKERKRGGEKERERRGEKERERERERERGREREKERKRGGEGRRSDSRR